jgi:channel protein (hemolysin III family)
MIEVLGFSDPFSSWSHLLAAVAAFIGAIFLCIRGRGNGGRIFSLIVYSFSLIFLFSMSGVYHLLTPGTTGRIVLQRLDYAGIWVLIAGTFTPVHIILFRGAWRWGILMLVWAIAITGLVLQIIFFESFPYWLTLILFLGLGWMGILTALQFRKTFTKHSLRLLATGGIFYSIGAIVDGMNWPILFQRVIGPHEIFHVFVILGALWHWRFIYEWADHPVANKLVLNVTIHSDGRYFADAANDYIRLEAKSLDDLKTLIQEHVHKKFRGMIKPEIQLRYFHEEKI